MVTGIDVSAPLGTAMHWNQINWLKCEAHTRKLGELQELCKFQKGVY